MVISDHAVQALLEIGTEVPTALLVIDDALSPFRMPTLMFISGMLLGRSLDKPTRAYFNGKLSRVAWPYVLWSIVALTVVGGLSVGNLAKIVVAPPTVYWYLWFLLAYYVIAFFTQRVPRWILIVTAVALAAMVPGILRADRFCFLFAFFIAGDWAAPKQPLLGRHFRTPWVVAVCVALATATGWLATTSLTVRYSVASIPGVLAVICVALAYLPATDRWATFGPFRLVGKNSLIYYVVHWPAITLIAELVIAPSGIGGGGAYAVLLAVGLVAPTVFMLANRRWAVVDSLFRWPSARARARRT